MHRLLLPVALVCMLLPAGAAQAAPAEHALTVHNDGHGTTWIDSGAGVSCPSGAECTTTVAHGTPVTITATPDSGYQFSGWTGCPPATANVCSFTVVADTDVYAAFTPLPRQLSVTVAGNGVVVSQPAGISCPSSCATDLLDGTAVTLVATPVGGHLLDTAASTCPQSSWQRQGPAWSCQTVMASSRSASAVFAVARRLTVTLRGKGSARLLPANQSCQLPSCSWTLVAGTLARLSALPAAGWHTAGWSGCTAGACSVLLSADRAVILTFARNTPTRLRLTGRRLRRGARTVPLAVSVNGPGTVQVALQACAARRCSRTLTTKRVAIPAAPLSRRAQLRVRPLRAGRYALSAGLGGKVLTYRFRIR